MFFLPAVLLAAWLGGLRPGLLATALSTIAMAYFLLPPGNSLWVDGKDDRVRLILFFIVGLGISVVCESLIAARRRAELNQQQLTREVEQRQQVEAAEREQRERLQITLASIGDAVIATDTAGQVTFLNAVAESLTGWKQEEAKGRLLEEVFCIINEKSRQSVEHPVAKVLREGRIVGLANHTVLIAKDGGEVPIDDSAAPIRDAQGVISGVVLVFRDITEQKQAEVARAERARLTALRADISAALASHHDLRPALQQCTEAIIHHLNLAEVTDVAIARIWTLNQTENVLALHASSGCYTHLDGEFSRVKVGEFKVGRIAQSRQPLLINDLQHDPNSGDPHWAAREGMVAFAGYPLLVEEQVYGVLALFARTTLSDGILKDLRPVADSIAQFINRKQVEESLRLSEQRYVLAEQATNDGVWDWNPLTGEDYLSPRWKALLGFAEDELANKEDSFFSRIHPDDVATVTEAVRLHFEERLPYEVELRLRCKDDSYRWFLARGEGLRDETGAVVRMVGSITDIAERKKAEAEIRRHKDQLTAFFENASMGLHWVDSQGIIQWANQAELELLGYSAEEYIGQPIAKFHADQNIIGDILARLLRGEKLHEYEARLKCKDGTERIVSINSSVHWEEGRFIHTQCFTQDITESKKAEAAVRQSEQRARFLAQASADFAEITDVNSTLQKVASIAVPAFADWCAVDLINPDGSLQRLAVRHTDPAKVRLAHELMERYPPRPDDPHGISYVVRSGQAEMMEEIPDELLVQSARDDEHLRIARALGLQSYICVPMQSKGKTLGVLTFVTAESDRRYDRDDLVAAEDLGRRAAIAIENANLYRTLQEADRRKDEFLATLAHELRNPLAPIRTGLHVLKMAQHNPVIAENTRTMMDRQLSHMVRLVDDLLDVSRITRGKMELRKERVELAAVVQNAVEASRPLIDQQDHELIVTLPPVPVYLEADATRLAQVLQNLLNNAAKYSERAGHIWLTAVPEETEIVIRVKDTGIGIPASHLPRIFDMFSQVDTALEKAQGGLGIGLSLVKGLVEMHGGTIAAASEGPGQGSEFVVRLPILVEQKTAPLLPDQTDEAAQQKGAQYRILVVDDNEDSSGWLATMLEMMGNEVRTAHDGEAGIAAAAQFRPDVILMDIGMPKMNGYEAAHRIRQEPWGKHPFLVALTGWGAEEDRRRTQEAGFNRHLVKPVDPEEIEKLLTELAAT